MEDAPPPPMVRKGQLLAKAVCFRFSTRFPLQPSLSGMALFHALRDTGIAHAHTHPHAHVCTHIHRHTHRHTHTDTHTQTHITHSPCFNCFSCSPLSDIGDRAQHLPGTGKRCPGPEGKHRSFLDHTHTRTHTHTHTHIHTHTHRRSPLPPTSRPTHSLAHPCSPSASRLPFQLEMLKQQGFTHLVCVRDPKEARFVRPLMPEHFR